MKYRIGILTCKPKWYKMKFEKYMFRRKDMEKDTVLDQIEKCIDEEKIEGRVIDTECEEETSIGRKMTYCREILGLHEKRWLIFLKQAQENFQIMKKIFPILR